MLPDGNFAMLEKRGMAMKGKKRIFVFMAAILAGYIFCTPMGALRAAVLLSGHPVSACTLEVRRAKAADVGLKELDHPPNSVIYVIEENVPWDRATLASLPNWIVYRYGCFYFGKHYGWC